MTTKPKHAKTPSTPALTKPTRTRRVPRTLGITDTAWRRLGGFLSNRSSDLAMSLIVVAAFVAVFEGSLYSATAFGFAGTSAIAFALMPDALMVLSAARMRRVGAGTVRHRTARTSMFYGLIFSLFSNMIAAFLRVAPEAWVSVIVPVGTVAYHGVVVIFLWRAVETLTKRREETPTRPARATEPVRATQAAQPVIPVVTRLARLADTALGSIPRAIADLRRA